MKNTTEQKRVLLQQRLDAEREKTVRNKMGQYATPYALAEEMMKLAKEMMGNIPIHLLEPAVGTGVFFSAFLSVFGRKPLEAVGYEIDPYYGFPSKELWKEEGMEIRLEDFLKAKPQQRYNLLIANPPYSRHHHIDKDEKSRLQQCVKLATGIRISGLASLYCYFIMLTSCWLEDGALSMWLVPSEFLDVNYGQAVKQFLLENVDLVRIHRFLPEDIQFADALVTSSIVIFRNNKPSNHKTAFTQGDSLMLPKSERFVDMTDVKANEKWSRLFTGQECIHGSSERLGDYFTVSRGLVTGDNHFFILDEETVRQYDIPSCFLRSVLPPPRNMKEKVVTRSQGLYLLTCDVSEYELQRHHPTVWNYIMKGKEMGVADRYICQQRTRWYSCGEHRPAPILIPYMGRDTSEEGSFRFILNETDSIATNSYLLLYPRKEYVAKLSDKDTLYGVWQCLNTLPKSAILAEGRTYGGGLHKLEPRELMNTPTPQLQCVLGKRSIPKQLELF